MNSLAGNSWMRSELKQVTCMRDCFIEKLRAAFAMKNNWSSCVEKSSPKTFDHGVILRRISYAKWLVYAFAFDERINLIVFEFSTLIWMYIFDNMIGLQRYVLSLFLLQSALFSLSLRLHCLAFSSRNCFALSFLKSPTLGDLLFSFCLRRTLSVDFTFSLLLFFSFHYL